MILKSSSEAAAVTPTRLGAGPDRLDSWKEIASYLKREVRTVQLWEKKEGLPVHRHYHNQLSTVFAFRSEIEQWGIEQASKHTQANTANASSKSDVLPVRMEVCVAENPAAAAGDKPLCARLAAEIVSTLERLEYSGLSILRPHAGSMPMQSDPQSASDYVLLLDTQIEGTSLQITVSLSSRQTRESTWKRAFQFLRESDAAMIADQIVHCLWLKIVSLSPAAPRTEKAASREAYLKGRYFWGRRDKDGLRKAAASFRTAIQEDPSFALPYSGLADSLTLLCFYEMEQPAAVMPEAYLAALRATELDPNLAEAHASLADIHLHFDRDWEKAEREYRRAIQCNAGYTLAYHWYANLLAAKGQHEAAQIAIMRALEIDPASLITQVWAGVTSYLAHRFDDAIVHYQRSLDMDPHFVWAHMYRAQALVQKGEFAEALLAYETTLQLTGGNHAVMAMKAHALAASGDRTAARQILRTLNAATDQTCIPAYEIAAVHVALGETAKAVQWLKRACAERSLKLFMLAQDARFDAMHRHLGFQTILESIGLKQHVDILLPLRPGTELPLNAASAPLSA